MYSVCVHVCLASTPYGWLSGPQRCVIITERDQAVLARMSREWVLFYSVPRGSVPEQGAWRVSTTATKTRIGHDTKSIQSVSVFLRQSGANHWNCCFGRDKFGVRSRNWDVIESRNVKRERSAVQGACVTDRNQGFHKKKCMFRSRRILDQFGLCTRL
jgi:hypothetical protein